jgi:hypothetical protein
MNGLIICGIGWLAVPLSLFFIFKSEQSFVCTQKLLIQAGDEARQVKSCDKAEAGFVAFSCDINKEKSFQTFGPADFGFTVLNDALRAQSLAPIEMTSLGAKQTVAYKACVESCHKEGNKKDKNEREVCTYQLEWQSSKYDKTSFKNPDMAMRQCGSRTPVLPPSLSGEVGTMTRWAPHLIAGAYSLGTDYYNNAQWRSNFDEVRLKAAAELAAVTRELAAVTSLTVLRDERNVSLLAIEEDFACTGAKKDGICCDASCVKDNVQVCGGNSCGSLTGGSQKCCTGTIAKTCRLCDSDKDTGCVFDVKAAEKVAGSTCGAITTTTTTTTTTTPTVGKFCTSGTPKDGVCCDGGCVGKDGKAPLNPVCGGSGCHDLIGGAAKCCTKDISQLCRICTSPTETGCVLDATKCIATSSTTTTTKSRVATTTTAFRPGVTTTTPRDGMQAYTPGAAFSARTRLFSRENYIYTCQDGNEPGCVRIHYQQSSPTKVSAIGKTDANGNLGKQAMKKSWGCDSQPWNVIFALQMTKDQILERLNENNDNAIFVRRIFLIVIVWFGIFCCLYPIIAMADIMSDFLEYIPCIGDFLGGIVDSVAYCVVCCFSCSFGVSLSLFAISVSWIVLRPLMGIGMMVVSILLCGVAGAVVQMNKKPKGGDDDLEMTNPDG